MKLSKRRKSLGLTIVELLIVIAIIGTLAAIAIPVYSGYVTNARNQAAITDIKTISLVIEKYRVDRNNMSLPNALSDINYQNYRDPWGRPYQYLNIQALGGHGCGQCRKDRFVVPINTDYDLYSMGKDGQSSSPLTAAISKDDIVRANNGAYIGLAYAY
jgi:general secretion pathway protein G